MKFMGGKRGVHEIRRRGKGVVRKFVNEKKELS